MALLAAHPPLPLLCRLPASHHLGPSVRGGLGQQGLGRAPSAVEPGLQLCFISFLAVYVGIALHPGKSDTVLAPGTRPGRSLHEHGSRGHVEAAVQPRPRLQVDREAHGSEGVGDGLRGGPGLAPRVLACALRPLPLQLPLKGGSTRASSSSPSSLPR